MSAAPSRAAVAGVAVLSGAALAYEILLIRLFAIAEWHHLAFLVISLALLGYGVSGTVIALLRERLQTRYALAAALCAAMFGITSVGAFLIFQRLDFNSLEIVWSRRELAKLFLLYVLFATPFFCAATAIGLTLTRFAEDSPRIYRADLIGAGSSAAVVTALLFLVHPVTALQTAGCTGFAAAALFLLDVRCRWAPLAILGGAAIIIATRPQLLPMRVSPFKELSQTLRITGAHIVEERSSPLALLSVVESPLVPFRYAPGLSLNYTSELPQQDGIFSDASGLTVVTRGGSLAHFDFVPSAAPYHLRPRFAKVVIVGSGGGAEVLSALTHGAARVTAVELNAQVIDLAGAAYRDRRVRTVNADARSFIRDSDERFDLIQIALVDSYGAAAAGVQALGESYLYTVEALVEMLSHLEPGGYLVITRWMQVPPRDILKLFATSAMAVERVGLRPARAMALVRTWNTATLIVKHGELTSGEVAALRTFCDDRSFDLDYAPGIAREETNRYNILDEPNLFDLASAIAAGGRTRQTLFDRYKFFIEPATDDRPYFFHFLKWRVLPELLRLRGRGGMPLVEWGYVILIAAIAQALLAAVVFLLLPLTALRRRVSASLPRLTGYFGSIGLAFLFLEMAFIQRLTLFLGHPLYAVAVVLSSFLVFAGIGSGFVERLGERAANAIPVVIAVVAIVELPLLRLLFDSLLGMPPVVKVPISVAVVAPLAFLMGIPFPSGLLKLARVDRGAIPWAWGINGAASVISSLVATTIAVHFGFSVVVSAAAALYLCARLSSP